MKYDVFFSICQTEVDGYTPSERQMWENFFDQVKLADELEYGTAWVAETHLSCQVQKENPGAVIPHFKGEIGLNTDILQLAHRVFALTKNINVGSAIRNILCNGGPIAHAEAVKTFLSLHALNPNEKRKLELGFASGRFPFSNTPYGIRPRNAVEEAGWAVVKNIAFQQATEIFLRLLRGENLSSKDIETRYLTREFFRDEKEWTQVTEAYQQVFNEASPQRIPIECFWTFDKVGVLPFEAPLEFLRLTIGSHDPETQVLANKYLPVGVFNLSITPSNVVEETHKRMEKSYKGEWQRELMPRTCLIFIDDTEGLSDQQKSQRAKDRAQKAWENYWRAMEKTLDPGKVEQAVSNAIAGTPEEVAEQIKDKYHPEDRLMLWFDFNNHNNDEVKQSMRWFKNRVVPLIEG